MSSQFSGLFTSNFMSLYLFGALIIILYAKDKFNKPTYDGSAMGPFAQLPPERLTIDRRYRNGWATYVFMLLALYTAICIIGPKTFPNLFDVMKSLPSQYQAGPPSANIEMWPVAAATFLVSTGALSDSSILGRIEYLIRQYAHKTAYIPRTVRDLARYFREIQPHEWLKQPQREDERSEQKKALEDFAGKKTVEEIENAGDVGIVGEVLVWARANILFYILENRVYKETVEMPDGRLDEMKRLPGNEAVRQDLKSTQKKLKADVIDSAGGFISDAGDVAKFLKDVSLTLSVLISQAARNQAEIDGYVRKLGLAEIHFRPPDSSAFAAPVSAAVLFGALASMVAVFVGMQLASSDYDLMGYYVADGADKIVRPINIFPWIAIVIGATVSYVISLRVITYFRDNAMDALEWTENLSSYIRMIFTSGVISAAISVISIVLLFAILDKLAYVAETPPQVAQLIATQFVLSVVVSAFSVYYFRMGARLSKTGAGLLRCLRSPLPLFHGAVAALMVGVISFITLSYARNDSFANTVATVDNSIRALFTSQTFISHRLAAPDQEEAVSEDVALATNVSSTASAPALSTTPQTVQIAKDARAKARRDHARKAIKGTYEKLQFARSELAAGFLIAKGGLKGDAETAPGADTKIDVASHTGLSLKLLSDACRTLNQIALSAPPPLGQSPKQCQSGPAAQSGAPATQASPASGPAPSENKPASDQPSSVTGNRPGATSTTGSSPQEQASPAPLPFTLFAVEDACVPNIRATNDCSEQPFLDLGAKLSSAYTQVDEFHYQVSRKLHLVTIKVTTITAFLVAYAFGVGFLYRRAAWLREGLDEPQGIKLKEEIKKSYGCGVSDELMIKPIRRLGNVSSLEALRYEEYSRKLFDLIKDKKIDEFEANPGPGVSAGVRPSSWRLLRAFLKAKTRGRGTPR